MLTMSTQVEDARLKARADARKEARVAFVYCREAHGFIASQNSDAAQAFWEEIRDLALAEAPLPKP